MQTSLIPIVLASTEARLSAARDALGGIPSERWVAEAIETAIRGMEARLGGLKLRKFVPVLYVAIQEIGRAHV
mgnify:CR=1 FL=1